MTASGLASAIGWLVTVNLLIAGFWKLRSPASAALASRNILDGLVPGEGRWIGDWFGTLLGVFELVLGSALAVGILTGSGTTRVAASGCAALFFAGILVLIARSLLLGRRFACSCFGAEASPISYLKVGRAAALATAGALVATTEFPAVTLKTVAVDLLLLTVAGALLAVIVAARQSVAIIGISFLPSSAVVPDSRPASLRHTSESADEAADARDSNLGPTTRG